MQRLFVFGIKFYLLYKAFKRSVLKESEKKDVTYALRKI